MKGPEFSNFWRQVLFADVFRRYGVEVGVVGPAVQHQSISEATLVGGADRLGDGFATGVFHGHDDFDALQSQVFDAKSCEGAAGLAGDTFFRMGGRHPVTQIADRVFVDLVDTTTAQQFFAIRIKDAKAVRSAFSPVRQNGFQPGPGIFNGVIRMAPGQKLENFGNG